MQMLVLLRRTLKKHTPENLVLALVLFKLGSRVASTGDSLIEQAGQIGVGTEPMSLEEHVNDIVDPTFGHVDKAIDSASRLIVLGFEGRTSNEVEKIDGRVRVQHDCTKERITTTVETGCVDSRPGLEILVLKKTFRHFCELAVVTEGC